MPKVAKHMLPPMTIKLPKRFVMPPPPRPEDRPVITIVLEEAATIDTQAWRDLMADGKHGGARPGAGRPTIDKARPPIKYLIAVTTAQREKIDANGGAPWVRGLIDAADGTVEAGILLLQFDRCLAGAVGFGRVDDPERMAEMVRAAGKVGVTLFWLKSVLAAMSDHKALGTASTTDAALADHYRRIPWSAPKHQDWKLKYKLGWDYDFASDEWVEPAGLAQAKKP